MLESALRGERGKVGNGYFCSSSFCSGPLEESVSRGRGEKKSTGEPLRWGPVAEWGHKVGSATDNRFWPPENESPSRQMACLRKRVVGGGRPGLET